VKRKSLATNKRMSTPIGDPPIAKPEHQLQSLATAALAVSAKARRHRQSLSGSSFYAGKLAELRSDAAIELKKLGANPANGIDTIEASSAVVFSENVDHSERVARSKELIHELKIRAWSSGANVDADTGLFPICILKQAGRGYMINVGIQMNGSYKSGWCDAAAVMMRRLLETAIVEAFEAKHLDSKIKNSSGEFFQLTELVGIALSEPSWNLTRNTKRALPNLKNVGNLSAHSRRYNARKPELDALVPDVRVVVEEFLHLANLLN
jgi:hypothetical protein